MAALAFRIRVRLTEMVIIMKTLYDWRLEISKQKYKMQYPKEIVITNGF